MGLASETHEARFLHLHLIAPAGQSNDCLLADEAVQLNAGVLIERGIGEGIVVGRLKGLSGVFLPALFGELFSLALHLQ